MLSHECGPFLCNQNFHHIINSETAPECIHRFFSRLSGIIVNKDREYINQIV